MRASEIREGEGCQALVITAMEMRQQFRGVRIMRARVPRSKRDIAHVWYEYTLDNGNLQYHALFCTW